MITAPPANCFLAAFSHLRGFSDRHDFTFGIDPIDASTSACGFFERKREIFDKRVAVVTHVEMIAHEDKRKRPAPKCEPFPMPVLIINAPYVCFSAQTRKHLLVLSLTAFDPSAT